jgi:integrase
MGRASKLKPTEVHSRKVRGTAAWCVNVPDALSHTGKRRQLFFKTRREAEAECEKLRAQKDNFGVSLSRLSPLRIAQAAKAFEMLDAYGLDLLQAVSAQIDAHKQRSASVSLGAAFDRFEALKQSRSAKYLRDIRQTRAKVASLLEKQVSDIMPSDLEPILDKLPPADRNKKMRELRAVFNMCAKRGWMRENANPIRKLDFTPIPPKPIEIFSADTVRALLEYALEKDLYLLPYQVLTFFCGIRSEGEMSRLSWTEVRIPEKLVVLPAAKTKKRETNRFIHVSENAIDWLQEYRARGGSMIGSIVPFSASTLKRKLYRSKQAVGLQKWIQAGARHTFCSHWLALYHDVNKLRSITGHGDAETLRNHYLQGVSEADAKKFWNIRPSVPAVNVVPMAQAV